MFAGYMRWGGLPYIALLDGDYEQADTYLEGIYNTIVVKDIELRQQRRESERTFHYQVTASMTEKSTFDREMAPFKAIRDNYPKTFLTLDRFTLGDHDGIDVINIVDWLLGQEKNSIVKGKNVIR